MGFFVLVTYEAKFSSKSIRKGNKQAHKILQRKINHKKHNY